MFVVTMDQRGSRSDVDRVTDLLDRLDEIETVRRFERTAGDEVQGVLDDPAAVCRVATAALHDGHWSVGVGVGPVDEPLPPSTRAGRGPAFLLARDAVETAKRRRVPLCIRGTDQRWSRHAQTAGRLLIALLVQRSPAGEEAVELMRRGLSQVSAADTLGITPQAMSQRLRAAGWDLEPDATDLFTDALAEADRAVPGAAR